MARGSLRQAVTGGVPVLGVVLLLVSLVLMSDATEGSARFDELFSALLLVNAVGLLTIAALIAVNLVRLRRQVAAQRPGARLTVRMVTVFVLLAVTPVLVVYYFSIQFLHRGIDSWFDVRVEQALDGALELSRTALGERMGDLLAQTELLAREIAERDDQDLARLLEDARVLGGAAELSVLRPNGHVVATSNVDPAAIVPEQPSETILIQLRQSGDYIGLDPVGKSGLQVRVVVRLPQSSPAAEERILQGLYPIAARMNDLADGVESTYAQYRELAYLRRPLKISFTLTLSLVLLLSLFTAVWAAFYSARRMVAPLRDLALGTQAVASGDLETQLPAQSGRDEVGFLVESFNDMTRRLARARDDARLSQQQVEEQRRYLEAVLTRLSTGVLTLDGEGRLHTANEAAGKILALDLTEHAGRSLAQIADGQPHLQGMADAVARGLGARHTGEWREEVTVLGPQGRQVLMCSGTSLPAADGALAGYVVVFDDITTFIQAQRDAAWSEVARRLAHEIKNPLTPIQLSAERLRHKYLARMESADGEIFDRLTRTIVQQVEAMKSMVNAFSSYARTPRMQPRRLALNELVADVVELYRAGDQGERITLELADDLPAIDADPDRLRQILHNLIKNAMEAQATSTAPEVGVVTRCARDAGRDVIEIVVADRGPGYPADIVDTVFEPYVTTKPRGSGLGMAIVKKIVEEHGGMVRAENRAGGGARAVIRLPALRQSPAVPDRSESVRSTAV